MATIKANGAPTKHTAGAVGSSYIDLETNKHYKCIFAFSDSNGNKEYDWRFISVLESETKSENLPEVEIQKNKPETEELKGADIDGEPEDLPKQKPNRN